MWGVDEPARRAYLEMKMPEVTYVDTFVVPNYEQRNPAPKYQMPFTADDSMKFIQVPAEFKLELFAKEPDIIEPIAFNFDERGRLWIIEAVNYPNVVLNGNPGDDRIKIVEDTNGDGRADKFTVFADHLNLPTSLVFANGGVIVTAAPHTLFLKDTNGDDKADVKQILHTGWGIGDTHAGPSSLMYGFDNHIWGTVGYSRFRGTGRRQVVRLRPGGLPLQARWLRLRADHRHDQQHLGPRHVRDLRRVRVDREQRSELLRRDSQPLLRRRRGPADAAGRRARGRRRVSERGAVLQRALRHPLHPPGRRVRRLHRGRRPSALHRARVPQAGTGTGSRSSTSRPRTWSGRASSRSAAPGS